MYGDAAPQTDGLYSLLISSTGKYKEQLQKISIVSCSSICSRIMFGHILSMSFASAERLKLLAKEGIYRLYSAERIDPLKKDFMDSDCINGLAERYLAELEYVRHMNGSEGLKLVLLRHFAKILCVLRSWNLIDSNHGTHYRVFLL